MNRLYREFAKTENLAPQARGKAFEKVIGLMLSEAGLRHILSFRPHGEEIDGAFLWESHGFLLEAKWEHNPVPASSIFAFKGKVDGKFSGTRGIFISMSGYSEGCKDATARGKNLNILLFDKNDIEDIEVGLGCLSNPITKQCVIFCARVRIPYHSRYPLSLLSQLTFLDIGIESKVVRIS